MIGTIAASALLAIGICSRQDLEAIAAKRRLRFRSQIALHFPYGSSAGFVQLLHFNTAQAKFVEFPLRPLDDSFREQQHIREPRPNSALIPISCEISVLVLVTLI